MEKLIVNDKNLLNIDSIDYLIRDKKIAIFDLDGTIANTEWLHWEAYNKLLNAFNITLPIENINRYIGHPEIRIYSMIQQDFSITFDEKNFLDKRIQIYLELVEKTNLKPFSFISDILSKYKNSCTYILVTSQIPSVVKKLLSLWKIDSFFSPNYRFCCHNGMFKKIDIYKDVTKYTQINDVTYKDIILFEDSEHYIKEAKALGISSIGIEHDYNIGNLKSCNLILSSITSKQ